MRRMTIVGGFLFAVMPCLVEGDSRLPSVRFLGDKATAGASFGAGTEFQADLLGTNEVPPVDTITTGTFEIKFNDDFSAGEFEVNVLDGTAITQAHLHCGQVGANGPVVVFLFGNVPGGFDVDGELAEFTMTDANVAAVNADCTAAIGMDINSLADLAAAAAEGLIYANVHSVAHPGGEIRGQLVPDHDDDDDEGDDEGGEDEEDEDEDEEEEDDD